MSHTTRSSAKTSLSTLVKLALLVCLAAILVTLVVGYSTSLTADPGVPPVLQTWNG